MPRSVMSHSFSEVPQVRIPRSSFNRSFGHKTTFDADYLIPLAFDDVVPGDTFNTDMHFYIRLASPTLYPLMDNLYFESFAFFIPYRLLWDNWEKMHGAQDNPADSIDFTVPAVDASTTANMTSGGAGSVQQLSDYFGLPHVSSFDLSECSALPFRAYNLTWNEWFRDQNLQDSVTVNTGNGPDTWSSDYALLKRGKRHDYFTSCLPWPQKGDAVQVPLGTTAPIMGLGIDASSPPWSAGPQSVQEAGTAASTSYSSYMDVSVANRMFVEEDPNITDSPNIFADLSQATGATINDWRLAFQTQRLLERDARSGTRYNELILAHFGVTVPDFRVQRPEFLGGGSTPLTLTPVAQTTYQGTGTLLDAKGALSSIGTISGRHGCTKSFVEHGIVLWLGNVRADITYSQGLERYWSKDTRLDFYYPVMSQIGEQAVLNKEIYYQNTAADEEVFGYQERYGEMRYKNSMLTGLMRPDNAASLDPWHLSEEFGSLPTLGSTFIESNTGAPLDRGIAVPSQPQFIGDFFFEHRCARPMPLFGVPGNLDRF